MSKDDNKPCHFNILKFKVNSGLGLKGLTRYDQIFLEELELHKLKNTDLALKTLADYCTDKKLNYKLMLVGTRLEDTKIIYEKK
jgi:hypothetical protein